MSKRNRAKQKEEKDEKYERLFQEISSVANPFEGVPLEQRVAFDEIMGAFAQTQQGRELDIDHRPISELSQALEQVSDTDRETPLHELLPRLQLDDNGNLDIGSVRSDTTAPQNTAASRVERERHGELSATVATPDTAVSAHQGQGNRSQDHGRRLSSPMDDHVLEYLWNKNIIGSETSWEEAMRQLDNYYRQNGGRPEETIEGFLADKLEGISEADKADIKLLWDRGTIDHNTPLKQYHIHLAALWKELGGPPASRAEARTQSITAPNAEQDAITPSSPEALRAMAQSPRGNSTVAAVQSTTTATITGTAATRSTRTKNNRNSRRQPNKKKKGRRSNMG